MNQQWISVIGLVLDFAGFSVLIGQWIADWRDRRAEMLRTAEQFSARAGGLTREPNEDDENFDSSGTMWRYGNLVAAGIVGLRFDLRLVLLGTALVLLGFLFQIAGNWPGFS